MSKDNPLRKLVNFSHKLPSWLGNRLLTTVFNYKVKFAGTAGIEILATDGQYATFLQRNDHRVQNHIGSVHAAAMALLAESTTGFIVGINLPGDKLPLNKGEFVTRQINTNNKTCSRFSK